MHKQLLNVIGFGAGIVILTIFVYKIGIGGVYAALQMARVSYLILALLMILLALVIGGINILLFVRCLGYGIPASQVIRKHIINSAINQAFPLRLSSFSLIYLLKRSGIEVKDGIAVTFVDKVITFGVLFVFGVIALVYFFPFIVSLKYIVLFLMLVGSIAFFIFSQRMEELLIGLLRRFKKFSIVGFSEAARKISRCYGAVGSNIILTVVKLVIMTLIPYVILLSLNVRVNVVEFSLISFLIAILASLPITSAGLGVREVSAVALYSTLMKIDAVVITAVYIIYLFLKYFIAVVSLAWCFRGIVVKPKKRSSNIVSPKTIEF